MGKLVTGGDMIASEAKYHPGCLLALYSKANKCIGNDTTKAAAHQSPNCIKKTINKIRRGLCRHAVRQCLSVCHVRRFRGVNGGGMGDASPPPQHFGRGMQCLSSPLAATNVYQSSQCHIQLSVDCHSSCMNGDIWR